MKRALAMGLGALMVAGTAAPAAAASHIDFSGYYRIMYMSETNTGHGRESRSFTDSYFQDRLNLDLTFSPTDEISVYWRLRGPGSYQRWGQYAGKSEKGLYTQFIYGEIKQDWGTVLIGRMSDDLDCAGLCTFGYMPENIPIYTNVGAFDRGDIMDGVRYSYDWDNGFSILAQYVKLSNNGETGGQIAINDIASDQDYDRFQLQGAYAWDGGGVSLHVYYDRNATGNGRDGSYGWGRQGSYADLYYRTEQPAGGAAGWWNPVVTGIPVNNPGGQYDGGRLTMLNKIETWGINPSIMHTFGDFSIHFEGMATWGTAQYRVLKTNGNWGTYDQDGEGYGAYLDFDYNYGPGNVTLAGWWVSGTDLNENPDDLRDKNKSLANLVGGNFYPLLVAYNGANSNPGNGNRYYGNNGENLSAIGFANNAYENYVYEGHYGNLWRNNAVNGGRDSFMSLNGNIDLNDAAQVVMDVATGTVSSYDKFFDDVLATDRTRTTSFNNDTDANHWAIALTGNHAFTDDISMHYGLAYLALNKPNYSVAKSATFANTATAHGWTTNGYTTQDKDLGFEIDLGFTFQLLDNLKFTSAFGYMFNGDAYKSLKGYRVDSATVTNGQLMNGSNVRAVWEDADDSYVWFNSLTFAF